VEKECMTVVAADSRFYGGGYEISPGSVIDDGVMELYIVDKLSKVQTARIILSMKKAGHLRHPALQMIRTNRARITAGEPVVANIDGEKLRSESFDLELIPKGMKIWMDHEFIKRMR